MRHVRMLGSALTASFALGALILASASPALAKKVGPYEKFYECPLEIEELNGCITGIAGKESFFQAGKVTVHFAKPVTLTGGFIENESGEFAWQGARNGLTVAKVPEPAPSLTEGLDAEMLQEPEKKRYQEYIAAGKSTKVTETIELANPNVFLSEANIVDEEGEGFGFNVMIHISNPFLGKACYDGTAFAPIVVPFTTGATDPPPPNTSIRGTAGKFNSESEGEILRIEEEHLVNNEYAAPGVSGCGVQGGADAAIDAGLGLPSPAGNNATVLVGTLYQTSSRAARENLHF